jgi:hypothetical protein
MSASKDSPKSPSRPPLTALQVLTIVGVVVWLLILLDFNRRLASEQQLVAAANQARTQLAKLEAEHSLLETQVAYATTDAAVIQWAHENGKMAKDGEVLVVPLVPTAQPTPLPPPVPLPTTPPTWVLWQNLFFSDSTQTIP